MLQLPAFPLVVAVPFPQVFFVISYLPTHSLSRESEKSMEKHLQVRLNSCICFQQVQYLYTKPYLAFSNSLGNLAEFLT